MSLAVGLTGLRSFCTVRRRTVAHALDRIDVDDLSARRQSRRRRTALPDPSSGRRPPSRTGARFVGEYVDRRLGHCAGRGAGQPGQGRLSCSPPNRGLVQHVGGLGETEQRRAWCPARISPIAFSSRARRRHRAGPRRNPTPTLLDIDEEPRPAPGSRADSATGSRCPLSRPPGRRSAPARHRWLLPSAAGRPCWLRHADVSLC